jgi:hypothetical protein
METVHLRAHTTPQGRLLLDLPTSLEDSDVEVTVTVQSPNDTLRDGLGWPVGFWQRFAGSMPDFPDIEDVAPEEVEPLR